MYNKIQIERSFVGAARTRNAQGKISYLGATARLQERGENINCKKRRTALN